MFDMFFKALGEPTRLKLVRLLAEKEMCICDLEGIMQISQPRISQHLKILKQSGLVSERRFGQKRLCRFNQEVFNQTMTEFEEFMLKPLVEIEDYHEEATRLKTADGKDCVKTAGKLKKKDELKKMLAENGDELVKKHKGKQN